MVRVYRDDVDGAWHAACTHVKCLHEMTTSRVQRGTKEKDNTALNILWTVVLTNHSSIISWLTIEIDFSLIHGNHIIRVAILLCKCYVCSTIYVALRGGLTNTTISPRTKSIPTFLVCFLTISSSVSSSNSDVVTVSSTSPKIIFKC